MNAVDTRSAIYARLDIGSILRLQKSAQESQKLESQFDRAISKVIDQAVGHLLQAETPELAEIGDEIEKVFIDHYFKVQIKALKLAESEKELDQSPDRKLAKYPGPRISDSLKKIMQFYDAWRVGRYTPKRPLAQAKKIKDLYVKKVQSVWERYSRDFRSGQEFNQQEVAEEIRREAGTVKSRAQNIVQTETTRYYNAARQEFYDKSEDVTHYLLMAVRDQGTTKWCTPKIVDGKRGRHGLVYRKGTKLFQRERPPCHWRCRSEILPLSPYNPAHLKLINDKSLQRENVLCHPLPRGWNS